MTEEQKRFKILKRTSYEEQISEYSKAATIKAFVTGLGAITALMYYKNSQQDISTIIKLVSAGMGIVLTGISADNLTKLMIAIGKVTMLQGKIEDINTELEMPENDKIEESKGMRK